jgi:hypothetical protein
MHSSLSCASSTPPQPPNYSPRFDDQNDILWKLRTRNLCVVGCIFTATSQFISLYYKVFSIPHSQTPLIYSMFFPLSITHVQTVIIMALCILTCSISNSIKGEKRILNRRITNINKIDCTLISSRMSFGFVADIPKWTLSHFWRTIVIAAQNLVNRHKHVFNYLCAYVYKSSASDRDSASFCIFTFFCYKLICSPNPSCSSCACLFVHLEAGADLPWN